ncbi:MAG: hypothetical protein K1Y02_23845 [Candidatus Hydrogenedentes bacterium]|nr:hypothetical protein [Candidatus Hydrogenedentota bacterium]
MRFLDRRSFLRYAGTAAAGLGFAGCATPEGKRSSSLEKTVKVRVTSRDDALIRRTFTILQDRIQVRCPVRVIESRTDADVILAVDEGLPREAYRMDVTGKALRISGGSPQGLLYGAGKFLRTSRYDQAFVPSTWRGLSEPHGSLRGMYFATHFHNWYHRNPDEGIIRYMEDMALWGVNAIMVIFPMINLQDWNDPDAEPAMSMVRQYAQAAHELGIQFVTGLNNTMFIGAPQDIRATRLPDPTHRRGNSGHPICPSIPAGHAYLMDNARQLYEKLHDVGLDVVCFWPYDEGGCACEKCSPWGSNGYLKLSRDFADLGRSYFPRLKTILSTWMFDTPPEGEWDGLSEALKKDKSWLNYILADAHEDFPRYPLEKGVPGDLPLLNFPEISMWGNWPWGGFGANPLPSRFQRLWDQVKTVVQGGFPYSEGIYEDMNKAIELQFYWNPDQTAQDTLREYVAYEFGPEVVDDTLAVVALLEDAAAKKYQKQAVDVDGVERCCLLAESVNARLPEWARESWRWEILHLRAILDYERFAGEGLQTVRAEAAMKRLMEIYHCQMETDDPYHHRVRPPLRGAISRKGQL